MWLIVILLLHVVLAWQRVPGSFVNVEAGKFGVWAVNGPGKVFFRDLKRKSWVIVPGLLKQVSVGGQVWGVNKANNIFMRTSFRGYWKRVAGALNHVSVSNSNRVWGVNKHDQVFRRANHRWERVQGALKQISVGEAGVWGVNDANDIYYRQGTFGDKDTAGSDWVKLPGKFKWISSGNRVFGVSPKNEVFERVGRSAQYPIGSCWKKLGGSLSQVDVGIHRQWGVNQHGAIYVS